MDIKPTEEELSKLQESLSLLADLISDGTNPDKAALEKVLLRVGLNSNHQWIRNMLERACPLLERAHNDVHGNEKKLIVAELEALGMKNFPAILTYDKAKPKPLSVEPPLVNFGCLKLGEGANTTLKVSGGLVKDVVSNRRLKISLLHPDSGTTLVKIQLSEGNAGESFKDEVVLRCDRGELKVPVSARWEKAPEEPPRLSYCPICKISKKSLFWNYIDKKYECLNLECKAVGPSLDKLTSPYKAYKR